MANCIWDLGSSWVRLPFAVSRYDRTAYRSGWGVGWSFVHQYLRSESTAVSQCKFLINKTHTTHLNHITSFIIFRFYLVYPTIIAFILNILTPFTFPQRHVIPPGVISPFLHILKSIYSYPYTIIQPQVNNLFISDLLPLLRAFGRLSGPIWIFVIG